MSTKLKRCFVIMPFSQTDEKHTKRYWTEHFESFLKPPIEECGLEAYRSEPLRGDVLRQIIAELVVCPVVVADLTDRNPNVFWELGVRQSFKHGTVTIAEESTDIPFDVSVKSTLFYYPENHIRNAKFIKQFKKALKDCISHPDSPDSHVLENISGRGTLYEIIRRDEATRRVKALISESKENRRILEKIYKSIKEEGITTARFRFPSVELLITHRYLDEDSSFYEHAEWYYDYLLMMNEQLALWEQFPETTEEWFSEMKKNLYDYFKKYEKALDATQKKLIVSF